MAYHNRKKTKDDYVMNTIIGPDSFVKGDVDSGGFTRVDGFLRGNLHAKGRVVVGEKARQRGSISGTTVTVGGVVDGNILASERLVVLPTALILGDVTTRRIEAGEGCIIHGKVRVCADENSWQRYSGEFKDKKQFSTQRYEGSHG
jgi:cytoskeletal protein CcmA (bactofilin family)